MNGTGGRLPVVLTIYLWLAQHILPRLWLLVLHRRLRRAKETLESVSQKTMQQPIARPGTGAVIWGHAVGLGESQALLGLVSALATRLPDHAFVVTFSTQSAFTAAVRMGLPPRCTWRFAPIDTPDAIDAFLEQVRPCLLICCEADLWPTMLTRTATRGIRMALVNGRISASTRMASWPLAGTYRYLLNCFDRVYLQDKTSASVLQVIGLHSQKVVVNGTIKALSPSLPYDTALFASMQEQLRNRWVWVLGSSHEGEEAIALAAHARLQPRDSRTPLLIIAPRYLSRSEAIAQYCPPDTPRRSRNELPAEAPVYIADSFGEMGLWYRLAHTALVGGSLVPVGGHNPFEPEKLGCHILFGPHVENFTESYDALEAMGLAEQVRSEDELFTALQRQFQNLGDTQNRPRFDTSPLEAMLDELSLLANR